jgi:ABC-2 type transport system permease protein
MMRIVAMKELRLLFGSPLAWVVLAFLQFIFALVFLTQVSRFQDAQPQLAITPGAPGLTELVVPSLFGFAVIVMLMVVPLLSMRLVAEERRNQTLPFLVSAPVSATQIMLGKFLGLLAVLALPVVLILLMCLSLYAGGRLDLGLLAANTLGLLLVVATFGAVGLYLSSLTAQPLLAAIGTYFILLGLWLVNIAANDPRGLLQQASLIQHFESFSRGTLSVNDLGYYIVLVVLFLLLAIRRLDADRLRG